MEKCFSRGLNTLKVSNQLHILNRQRLLNKLRKDSSLPSKAAILLEGGHQTFLYCTDVEILFRQESFFHWTFGVEEPDFYGAIDISTGKSYLFSPKVSTNHVIWLGKQLSLQGYRERYGVDEVHYSDNIKDIFHSLGIEVLLILSGKNTDSGTNFKEATFDGIDDFKIDNKLLYPTMAELRVFKTDLELELLRYINSITSKAHKEIMMSIKPGMYEYQLESIFNHYCYYYGGARFNSYTCISTSGPNCSILHYGHSGNPNKRQIRSGDMCLIDMGCEYNRYASDITCSFPANGKFTEDQKLIYNAVLKANREVIKSAKPGVSWVQMHLLAERVFLQALKEAGLLIGEIDEMMEHRLGAVFMPHGLGHFIGIDVHDVGGYLEHCPSRHQEPGLASLRTARKLEKGMVLTIEPGVYFIDLLLDKAFKDPNLSKFLIKDAIERFRNFGGVRIEDNVYINDEGVELLTEVPRTVEEIEKLMAK